MSDASFTSAPATCFTIRNGWAWAHMFVRAGVANDQSDGHPRYWVNVSVISDYGSFGFCWTHCGEAWRKFLAGLDFDYAMKKFMGARLYVPISTAKAAERARTLVLRNRREDALDRSDARKLWDAIDVAQGVAEDRSDFLRRWDDHSDGLMYRHELWDANWDEYDPAALGFWSNIWPHFIAGISEPPTGEAR